MDAMQVTGSGLGRDQPYDSLQTRTVFTEVFRLINVRMQAARTMVDDVNIVTLLQLLCGEIIRESNEMLAVHEQGLWAMVGQRGGLERLGSDGAIAGLLVMYVVSRVQSNSPS